MTEQSPYPHITQNEHPVPSPRDLRVLYHIQSFPKLREFTQPDRTPSGQNPNTPVLVLPDRLAYPHHVHVRFPGAPGSEPSEEPSEDQTALAVRPEALSQSHHLAVIAHSEVALYWAYMTSKAAGAHTQAPWPDLPVPPMKEADINDQKTPGREQTVRERYGFSTQDKATIADALRYIIIPQLTGQPQGHLEHAGLDQMEAYRAMMARQLNPILRHANLEIQATFHMAPQGGGTQACRLDFVPLTGALPKTRTAACPTLPDLLGQISPETAAATAAHLERTPFARVYDNMTVWLIKPPQERHWTITAALNDTDLIVQDHLKSPQNT